jgi:sterol desaturase/sphingolipid hydroxylase (fatty acid hydroxylase superfamily)
MVPKPVSNCWLYSGFNTVTHHDTHHTNIKLNFGAFFNIWDRWMGTFADTKTPWEGASGESDLHKVRARNG